MIKIPSIKIYTQVIKALSVITMSFTFFVFPSHIFAQENLIAIVNAVVIDGNGKLPIENANIIIRGEQIEAVGTQVKIPAGAKIIDAAGRVAMPGLADMHVHLGGGWTGDGHDLLGYQRRLKALMYAGVTTVLDTGGVLPFVKQMRQAIEAGRIPGPYIYYVGPLIDSADPTWKSISLSMTSRSQAPRIALYLKNNGADAIKAYGGLSGSQIRSLVRAGRKQGLPVIVDAWIRNGAEHLVDSGLLAFAHIPSRVTDETLKTMKNRGVHIITTLAVVESYAGIRIKDTSFLQHDLIKSTTASWALDKLEKNVSRELSKDEQMAFEYSTKAFKKKVENVKRILDAGIPLVAGTDAIHPGVFAGEAIHHELELLVEAGLSPLQAITSATKNAAMLMNDEDKWGTLAPGKRADIILVNGRPDKNIADTKKVELVMQKGSVVDRQKLIFNEETDAGIRETIPGSTN